MVTTKGLQFDFYQMVFKELRQSGIVRKIDLFCPQGPQFDEFFEFDSSLFTMTENSPKYSKLTKPSKIDIIIKK